MAGNKTEFEPGLKTRVTQRKVKPLFNHVPEKKRKPF